MRSGEGSLRDRSFSVTGPKLFNELPATLMELNSSLDAFKRRLDKFLEGIDNRPPLPGYVGAAGGNSSAAASPLKGPSQVTPMRL